jgi:hypothetical protein
MRPHPGVSFCAPRSRMANAFAPVLGASFGWDHLRPKSLAAGTPHRPLKSGSRFSKKALIPSFESSVSVINVNWLCR